MSDGLKVLFGLLTVGLVLTVTVVGSLVGINNEFVALEKGLEAQYKQNQNSYDKMYKTVVETANVQERYSKDFKTTYDSMMTGRYGEGGSKAVFQMITESNPQLDPSVYKQLQQLIESNRESFKADQQSLLDKKRVYETKLGQFPHGFVAKFMGFPRIDLSKIDIVTSERTEKTFETKKDEPLLGK